MYVRIILSGLTYTMALVQIFEECDSISQMWQLQL